jgi:signal transduction histidine kinase
MATDIAGTPNTSSLRKPVLSLGLGLFAALGLALVLAMVWMEAPRQDLADLVRYLLFSGFVSLGPGALAIWWLQGGRGKLWQQVSVAFSLGIGIALFNIFLTARLMFISADHDLLLLVLLLLFAAVVSLTLGYILARALAQRVITLCIGARAISDGDLRARVPAQGSDELSELAQEFNRMADQLAASDNERRRLEANRRELIAAISHDLRTPLASVRLMTEALADRVVEDPATVQRYLGTMRSQIGHLSSLINDLFELSQIDAGAIQLDLQRVSVVDLVGDTVEAFQAQARARGVHLHGQAPADLPDITCAPQKIERVLYNLIGNALRHTPSGGTVSIHVFPDTRRTQAGIRFEVHDTGEGIPAEDLPHVFDSFYRGEKSRSRATGGAGLGLAIARGFVEAHRGEIWISSQVEQGTIVTFWLPVD